jgi:N-acetylmuramoyl-L-alanine amidase
VTVVLDAGHNGRNAEQPAQLASPVPAGGFSKPCNTVGASTDAGYPEHAFAFDVVLRTAARLRERGATVVLTRDDDDGFGPCVDARAAVGNRAQADAVVSIHADGGPATGRGFHVIAPALAPDGGNAAVLEPSYRLALAVREEFRTATGLPAATYTASDGLVRRADLAGLNLSRVPAVLLECGNMRNAADAAALSSPAWRERAATAVATAVERFVTAG